MQTSFHHVHFVGIGGIGMSSLAQHLIGLGCTVSGSDRQQNEQTKQLQDLGAQVFLGHSEKNVCGAQLVVKTSAVSDNNEEIVYARQHNIPVVLREQLLGEIFDSFQTRIAVCGTHGKTTVTAMIHHVLERCQVPHAAFIGGRYDGKNYFPGQGTVVAEACEYNRSFLRLHPTHCVCVNIEYDHPDCYKSLVEVQQAFEQFFSQSKNVMRPSNTKNCFGMFSANNIISQNGRAEFDVLLSRQFVCRVKLSVFGVHNIANALAVFEVARQLGLPLLQVGKAVSDFRGVQRRWTEVPDCVCKVVCDYAHHPTEIGTTVRTAKAVSSGRVICVFQPHTYSRTKAFFSQFVSCFNGADLVVFLPVYSARENSIPHASSQELYALAQEQNLPSKFFFTFAEAADFLRSTVCADDLVVLVGAGNVDEMSLLLKR